MVAYVIPLTSRLLLMLWYLAILEVKQPSFIIMVIVIIIVIIIIIIIIVIIIIIIIIIVIVIVIKLKKERQLFIIDFPFLQTLELLKKTY